MVFKIKKQKEEFNKWNSLTHIGKISWWYKVCVQDIISQLKQIHNSDYLLLLNIEDFNFKKLNLLCDFIGFENTLSKKRFYKIFKSRPGKNFTQQVNSPSKKWTDLEKSEFELMTSDIISELYSF